MLDILPLDVISIIAKYLDNYSIYYLHITCKSLHLSLNALSKCGYKEKIVLFHPYRYNDILKSPDLLLHLSCVQNCEERYGQVFANKVYRLETAKYRDLMNIINSFPNIKQINNLIIEDEYNKEYHDNVIHNFSNIEVNTIHVTNSDWVYTGIKMPFINTLNILIGAYKKIETFDGFNSNCDFYFRNRQSLLNLNIPKSKFLQFVCNLRFLDDILIDAKNHNCYDNYDNLIKDLKSIQINNLVEFDMFYKIMSNCELPNLKKIYLYGERHYVDNICECEIKYSGIIFKNMPNLESLYMDNVDLEIVDIISLNKLKKIEISDSNIRSTCVIDYIENIKFSNNVKFDIKINHINTFIYKGISWRKYKEDVVFIINGNMFNRVNNLHITILEINKISIINCDDKITSVYLRIDEPDKLGQYDSYYKLFNIGIFKVYDLVLNLNNILQYLPIMNNVYYLRLKADVSKEFIKTLNISNITIFKYYPF